MIHRSPCTADKFAEEYDRHGDSYTQDATIGSLKDVFNNVQTQVEYYYGQSAKRILYRFYQTVIMPVLQSREHFLEKSLFSSIGPSL